MNTDDRLTDKAKCPVCRTELDHYWSQYIRTGHYFCPVCAGNNSNKPALPVEMMQRIKRERLSDAERHDEVIQLALARRRRVG